MSSQAFNFSGVGAQTSSAITVNAGELARLRVSWSSGYPALSLSITQNGITDVLPIQAKSGDAIDLPACVAGDSIFVTYEGQTVADAANGVLESILDQLAPGSSNGSTGPFWQATQPVSLATVPLAAGAALDTSLQSILTALQAQRSDTLWTDDSGAFYIRTDDAGTITWFTISGGASSAPGTGARPAAGASIIVDSSRYQAMTAATGYSVGDYLSHVVTTDPNTGAILGHFWINVTTNAKLASDPASANITPISPLATGAATLAQQLAEAGILTSILAACLASTPPGTALIGSVDTVIKSAAADRGAIIGFTGAVFTPVNGTNTVTLTTAPTVGSVQLGMILAQAGIPAGSYLYALASGALNAVGSTYTLSSSPTSLVAANATTSTPAAAASAGPQTIMAANANRRGVAYQNQSTSANLWFNGIGSATADYHGQKLPAGAYFESTPIHIGTGAIAVISDTPGVSLYAREF